MLMFGANTTRFFTSINMTDAEFLFNLLRQASICILINQIHAFVHGLIPITLVRKNLKEELTSKILIAGVKGYYHILIIVTGWPLFLNNGL